MALAEDFQRMLDALPPDWTDLEIDLRIDDEEPLHRLGRRPQPGQRPALLAGRVALAAAIAHSFGHAAAAESVKGVLTKLDLEGTTGEMRVAEVREGRSEAVQMWGRPESVREEFRQRRSI